jgi:steroid delta-isomerase-like uncharacterized protein
LRRSKVATPSDVHREYIGAILARDWDKVKGMIHPDYTYASGDGLEMPGADVALQVAQTYTAAFPDLRIDIKQIHVAGNVAVAEFIASGTHNGELMGISPTGKSVTMPVCNVLEVRDGRIYREREYFDQMTMLAQLGLASPPGHA